MKNEGYCENCSRKIIYASEDQFPKETFCIHCNKKVKILTRLEIYDRDILRLEEHIPTLLNTGKQKIWGHMEDRGSYDSASIEDIIRTLEANVSELAAYSLEYDSDMEKDDCLAYLRVEGADITQLVLMVIEKLVRKKYADLDADREKSESPEKR